MKAKQLAYLAKLNLKQRKKSSRIMIMMLAVSMIIIIPVFALWMSVSVSIYNQINSMPYTLYSQVLMTDYRIDVYDNEEFVSGKNNISKFDSIDDKIVFESFAFSHFSKLMQTTITLNGKDYILDDDNRFYNVIDTDKSKYFFPKNLSSYGSIFVDDCDQSFTDNGKKQVVISQLLLDYMGIDAKSAYKQNISIYSSSMNHNGYLCYEYEIVGVIKREITQLFQSDNTIFFTETFGSGSSYMSAMLFFCSDNVYKDGKAMLKPIMSGVKKIYVYPNINDKETLNKEFMMIGIGCPKVVSEKCFSATSVYLEANDYADLTKLNSHIKSAIGSAPLESLVYQNYKKLYNISNVIIFVLAIIGIILLIVALLNFYLNIKHNIIESKNFLAMLRAIGAHDKDIPQIFMMQSNILCGKASLIFAVFGFALCSIIKFVIDFIMNANGLAGVVSISWISILLNVLGMIVLIFAITNIISLICASRLSKQPIMEILHKEQ